MKTLPLTPVDYLFTGDGSQPITFALVFAQRLEAERLQRALAQTLNYFSPLRSLLTQQDENNYVYRMSPQGAEFTIVNREQPFSEKDVITDYIAPVMSQPEQPLSRIRLTQTPSGSVLAVSVAHALVDGYSYFHFLSSWARISRGEPILPPSLERAVILPSSEPPPMRITAENILTDAGLFWVGKRPSAPQKSPKVERLFLAKDAIGAMLAEIKPHYPHLLFSENDAITAFLWQKYLPLWCKGDANQPTFVTCPVDFRRVIKSLPKNYFGCAICFATATIGLEALQSQPFSELASLVHRATRAVNEAYAMRFLRMLEAVRQQQGIEAVQRIHLKHPQAGLIVTNLTRMPLRELDFGAGQPENFIFYSEVFGSAAILPANDGVEVVVVQPLENEPLGQ